MRYSSKQFLSPSPNESGTIITIVETPLVKDISKWQIDNLSMTASVTFRACYGEPLTLEFEVSGESSFAKRVAKIDLMIDELEKFKSHFINGWENHLKNIEFKRKELEGVAK